MLCLIIINAILVVWAFTLFCDCVLKKIKPKCPNVGSNNNRYGCSLMDALKKTIEIYLPQSSLESVP